jgi:hypothetical protein
MDWIFDHLQFVIAAAAAVAYWLNQRKSAEKEKAAEDKPSTARFPRHDADESQDADRARRVREEIRRKIAERTDGRSTRPSATQPPPLADRDADDWRRIFRPESPSPASKPVAPADNENMTAVLERQRRLSEQMAELERTRLAEKRAAHAITTDTVAVARVTRVGSNWRSDLRDKEGLRRAMILREVLGPPAALR